MMGQDDLTLAVTGQRLVFYDDATARFADDGKYAYTYEDGGTWLGLYETMTDSSICITFVTGVTRYDLYVRADERLVLVTAESMRFPIKHIEHLTEIIE